MNDENKAPVSPSRPLICSTAEVGEIAESDDDFFVSPIKKSSTVHAKVTIGDRVQQPPIDEDECVYYE
ncbi:MAG: hypothetical protein H7Z37_02390 [Pyrinomonadaceae bacterium]|nr:hypothetical protein [Pyrinomonadaceae bacterium]